MISGVIDHGITSQHKDSYRRNHHFRLPDAIVLPEKLTIQSIPLFGLKFMLVGYL